MILILGGAGYIGSHFAKLLRKKGAAHIVVDNLSAGHRSAVGDSSFVQMDISDTDALAQLISERGIEDVVLFAGSISVGESMRDPGKYFENNIGGCLSVLRAMERAEANRILFSSTAAVYGSPEYVPIDEGHPKRPTNTYGESKLCMERMLDWYCKCIGFRATSLRYFNAAGADPEGELGEDHDPEEHLIPVAIEAALGTRPELTIFGDDYETPDGTCVRDYVHVNDLAQAHLLALEAMRSAEVETCHQYNLGNGKGFSVREVMDTVSKVAGREVPHKVGPRRAGDPAQLVASADKARTELTWKPEYEDLVTIVRHAWDWKSSHPNGYGD